MPMILWHTVKRGPAGSTRAGEWCRTQAMLDVTPTRVQEGILDTKHGPGRAKDMMQAFLMVRVQVRVYRLITFASANSLLTHR